MVERVAELRLDANHAIRVVATESGHRAEPVTYAGAAAARAAAGDGAGFALLHRLRNRSAVEDGFRLTVGSWLAVGGETERAMGVDQTHTSWVVGDRVVVKWMTEPLAGPHPAADRLRRLAEAGYDESPTLVGVVEWQVPGSGEWVPVAVVQEYLPDSTDGWTWAQSEARRALGLEPGAASEIGGPLGDVVGRLHLALAGPAAEPLGVDLARRRADEARQALDLTIGLVADHDPGSYDLLVAHRPEIETVLGRLDEAAATPAIPLHGDLHVGQVLRDGAGRYAVVDLDGNPTLPADLRAAPGPAAADVATMLVSLENVEHVVRGYHPALTEEAGRAWTTEVQGHFLAGYRAALGDRGDLYDEALVPAYEWEQVCREFLYAIRHDMLEWLPVPAAAVRRRLAPEA